MTLPNLQDYYLPESAEEAFELLARFGDDAMIVAGGTFVHGLEVRGVLENVVALIDIRHLKLDAIGRGDGGEAVLGATATLNALAHADFVRSDPAYGCIRDALRYPPQQILNVGTVGGCVAAAAPLYDLPAALLALDGVVRARSPGGRREIPLAGFALGLFENALERGEIVEAIALPGQAPRTASAFLKLESNANDLAIVSTAVRITLDGQGVCTEPRVVIGGGCGETYVRARGAEAALAGSRAGEKSFAAAAAAATGDFEPVSDHRGSAEYRRHVAGVLVTRALATALGRLGAGAAT
jgi:carbon-monoxide dehydrogenase medium subunit